MEVQRHVDQTLGERHVNCDHDLSLRAGAGVGIVTFTNPVHCSAHLSDFCNVTEYFNCKNEIKILYLFIAFGGGGVPYGMRELHNRRMHLIFVFERRVLKSTIYCFRSH